MNALMHATAKLNDTVSCAQLLTALRKLGKVICGRSQTDSSSILSTVAFRRPQIE